MNKLRGFRDGIRFKSLHPHTQRLKDLRVVEKLTPFWRSPIVKIAFARAIDTVPPDLASYGPSIRFSAGCRHHRCGLRNGLGVAIARAVYGPRNHNENGRE